MKQYSNHFHPYALVIKFIVGHQIGPLLFLVDNSF